MGIACIFVLLTCRLINANLGDLDPFFDPELNGTVSAIVVQPDGRILIGGFFTQVNGTDRPGFARLYPDGSLDTSFDPAEWPTGSPGSLAVRPDGRIIVGKGFGRVLELHTDGSVLSGVPNKSTSASNRANTSFNWWGEDAAEP